MYAALFDRFETDDDASPEGFAFGLAEVLSGRRIFSARGLGVLSWGMPSMSDITSRTPKDRQRVADYIMEVIDRFEPRLEDVKVTPVDGAVDFSFRIDAQFVQSDASSITLRILSPMVGGGLGAKVVVLDVRRSAME
jgi:hypothetical protein